jgi:ornithine decarboxylase
MNPQDANREFIRGNVELVRLSEAEGRVAAEGRCRIRRAYYAWCPARSGAARTALFPRAGGGVNMLPGFSPELQGVYSETDPDGIKRLYGYVLKG